MNKQQRNQENIPSCVAVGDYKEEPIDSYTPTPAREWFAKQAKKAFGRQFIGFALVTALSGVVAYYVKGPVAFGEAFTASVDLLHRIVPRFGAALLVAGFIRVLVSQEFIARWLGDQSGVKGLLIAGVAGALTPGGPVSAFSLIAALKTAGADRGVLVAYSTGWSILGFQRILLWELPLLGEDIVILRVVSSCMLPLIAGAAARRIPININSPEK